MLISVRGWKNCVDFSVESHLCAEPPQKKLSEWERLFVGLSRGLLPRQRLGAYGCWQLDSSILETCFRQCELLLGGTFSPILTGVSNKIQCLLTARHWVPKKKASAVIFRQVAGENHQKNKEKRSKKKNPTHISTVRNLELIWIHAIQLTCHV